MERVDLVRRVTLGDIIRRNARRRPDSLALVDERERRYTYAEFNQEINKCAHAFHRLGLKKGDRVATLAMNSGSLLVFMFGAAKAGLVFTPINPGLSNEMVRYVLNHSEAKLFAVDDALFPKIQPEKEKFEEIDHRIKFNISGDEVPSYEDFEEFIKNEPSEEFEKVEIWERDLSKLLYTSGTTAEPKGVMVSHLAEYVSSLGNIIDIDIRENDVFNVMMPLFHCAMLTLTNSVLHVGAAGVVFRQFDPQVFLKKIQEHRISWVFALPMMYRALLGQSNLQDFDLSSLRFCLYAMAPMDQVTLRKCIETFQADFALGTGMTEAYPSTFVFRPEDQLRKEGSYWGVPSTIYDCEVVDPEGNILPRGEEGELVYRGAGVMEGYLKNEEATNEAFKNGWFHSGDMGMFDEEGQFIFLDRKKDMIKTGLVYCE